MLENDQSTQSQVGAFVMLFFFFFKLLINILYFSLKNVEKEQHSIIFSKKNDKDLGELYEMFLINESNRKNESKRAFLFLMNFLFVHDLPEDPVFST
jgi:hypothetical protein